MTNPRTVILRTFKTKDFFAKMQTDNILEALYPYFTKEVQDKYFTKENAESEV